LLRTRTWDGSHAAATSVNLNKQTELQNLEALRTLLVLLVARPFVSGVHIETAGAAGGVTGCVPVESQ
jgi:hypothetical protein